MKLLKPARLRPQYFLTIESAINEIFRELIYKPIQCVADVELRNRRDTALVAAIKSGRIEYADGVFTGTFNAAISKDLRDIGARYDGRGKKWVLTTAPPADVQLAQAQTDARFAATKENVLRVLDAVPANLGEKLAQAKLDGKYSWAIRHMNADFVKSVQAVTVAPMLTDEQERNLAREYSQNLDLYIKNFTDKNILKLREEVRAATFGGTRPESLAAAIQKNYKTTKAKAAFLARQETSLLLSKFHEERYKDVGVRRYKWSTSHDSHVRPDHKLLDGKVFSWDQPPIVDRSTGRRANPGEDYECRCVPIPIWE